MNGHMLASILVMLGVVILIGGAPVAAALARRHATVRRSLGVFWSSLGILLAVLATAGPGIAGDQSPLVPAAATAAASQNPDATPDANAALDLDKVSDDAASTESSGAIKPDQDPANDDSAESAVDGESLAPALDESLAPRPTESQVVIPPGRPSWVETRPVREGPLHTTAVQSELHAREPDCWKSLDQAVLAATHDYIAEQLGDSRAPLFFNYSVADIKSRFLRPENVYHEVVQVSFGPMHQAHALLEFPAEFRSELDAHWQQVQLAGRLIKIGIVAAGVLALLSVLYGYFRVDTATRGYYTARLQFLTAAAILAVIVAGVLMARSGDAWIQWLL